MKFFLFYKKILSIGGAENLLIEHYNFLKKKNKIVKIVTYKNDLLKSKEITKDIIEVKNIIGLFVFFLKENSYSKIICHSGYIDIFLSCVFFFKRYSIFLHQPTVMSYNEQDKYALKNLNKLSKSFKSYIIKKNILLYKKIFLKINLYKKTYLNLRFIISYLAIRYSLNVFVLSKISKIEKKSIYNINTKLISGAIKEENIFRWDKKKNKKIKLCIMSRIDINKRIKKVLRAINISKNKKKILLDIYGKGPHLKEIKKTIKHLRLGNFVKYKGFLEERKKFQTIFKYDFFICVDMADFRISSYESLKAKTPVILTNETPIDQTLKRLNCFHYCTPTVLEISKLLENIKKYRKLKINWIKVEKYLRKFTWNNYFNKVDYYVRKN